MNSSSRDAGVSMHSTYPTLTDSDVQAFIDTTVRGAISSAAVTQFLATKVLDDHALDPGHSAALEEIANDFVAEAADRTNREAEPVEARFCWRVFQVLDSLPDPALGDREFWNYLAVRHFWQVIRIRQNKTWETARGQTSNPDGDETKSIGLRRYFIGKDHYQIPLRMYLRAQAVHDGDDASLCDIPGGGTDFWRSQVLGVDTGYYPPIARSVARAQAAEQLSIDDQRPCGKSINRLRVNVEYVRHTDEDCAPTVEQIWKLS